MNADPRRLRTAKLVTVAAVAVLLVIAQRRGVFEQLGSPERVRQTLLDLGGWGYLAFVVTYALLQPFGLSGTVFVLTASLVWPWPVAFALSMAGTMGASVVGFAFARFVARDWVARRIPGRLRRYEAALERRQLLTVFLLRFVFWMPPMLHAFFGVSTVRFWPHFWGSFAGYFAPILVMSLFGERLFDAMRRWPMEAWVAIGCGTLAATLAAFAHGRCRKRRDAAFAV